MVIVLVAALLAACTGIGASPTPEALPACPTEGPTETGAQATLTDADRAVVEVHSESGNIDGQFVIELHGDEAPLATANFVSLAECGFYDGISFHRVLAGFVAQAGDPQTKENRGDFAGLGTGGPPGDYQFEIEPPAEGLNYDPYVVSMANAGQANTNGSQFFINLADLDDRLPRDYTIFGTVVEGTDLIDAIGQVPVNDSRIGVPLDPVIIDSIRVEASSD
jgi:peptidyl-prolyl cis-trans isomerase B (cyclophilin B)